jgi:hypothetical protein
VHTGLTRMVQYQLKLRLSGAQKRRQLTWLPILGSVFNFGVRKIEHNATNNIYFTAYEFQNLLAGHSDRLEIIIGIDPGFRDLITLSTGSDGATRRYTRQMRDIWNQWYSRSIMSINPADYVPTYDEGVQEWLPYHLDLGIWPINKQYCLMPSSAVVLAALFDPSPAIVMSPPITQAPASPFAFSHNVPWFQFKTGQLRNAGLLASYWGMPGVPGPRGGALEYAKWDVSTWIPGDPGNDPNAVQA